MNNENTTWKAPTTIWNVMFLSIFFSNMTMQFSQQMSNSQLSLYAKSLGSPADQIGSLMSMFAVTALIFRFISGPAMNSFNRKYLLCMAMTLMTTAYLGFSFAPTIAPIIGVETITVLKGFRLIQGIGNAFGNSCCLTIVSDVLPKDKFTTGMSYYALAQVVSQSIGPTIGVFLSDTFGYKIAYIIIACCMICAIFLAFTMVKLAPREKIPFSLNVNNMIAKEALVPAGITFLVAMGFTSINAFMLVYAEERGIVGASLFFTVYALSMLVTRPMIGKLTDKYGFTKVGIPAIFMTAISLVLIGISTNLPMLLFAAFVNSCGYGAVQPALQSLCMKSVVPERRGSASSTNYIGMDSATIIGPTVCGIIADKLGYTPMMWAAMAIPCVMGALFIFLMRKQIVKIEIDFQSRNIN